MTDPCRPVGHAPLVVPAVQVMGQEEAAEAEDGGLAAQLAAVEAGFEVLQALRVFILRLQTLKTISIKVLPAYVTGLLQGSEGKHKLNPATPAHYGIVPGCSRPTLGLCLVACIIDGPFIYAPSPPILQAACSHRPPAAHELFAAHPENRHTQYNC